MYILISVPNEAFERVMRARALQRRLGIDTSVYRNASQLSSQVEKSFGGRVVLLDWTNGQIVADTPAGGASGLAVDVEGVWVSSWTENTVHRLAWGGERSTLDHAWFNHLHTAELTEDGSLLVASAGADVIVDLSMTGETLWYWYGPGNGFGREGVESVFDAARDYRTIRTATSERAMHVTSALPLGHDRVLAALFHQGALITIDRESGAASVVMDGLVRPHGIHRRPGGFILSDTLGHRIVLFDESLRVCGQIPFGSHWLQDSIVTSAGGIIALENVHIEQEPGHGLTNRIAELDASGAPLRQLTLPADHRLFAAREVNEDTAQWMMNAWGRHGDLDQWTWS